MQLLADILKFLNDNDALVMAIAGLITTVTAIIRGEKNREREILTGAVRVIDALKAPQRHMSPPEALAAAVQEATERGAKPKELASKLVATHAVEKAKRESIAPPEA